MISCWSPKEHDGVGVVEQQVEEVSLSTDDWVSTVFELVEPVAIIDAMRPLLSHARK